ncbi:MAG: peptidoglycan-binding domain-containing protein [Acidimicrobiia bacterium]|nr:peptidoglycan-binding domain-containing protein [Acidimicrobiia bacterium]
MIWLTVAPTAALACDAQADGSVWSDNCTIGEGFDEAANYITGTQRILKALGFYGGNIDGLWGTLSEGATKNYQADEGLTADGIVGTNTWGHLDDEIIYYTYGNPYKYYRTKTESCAGSFRWSVDVTNLWYIKKLNGTWQTNF